MRSLKAALPLVLTLSVFLISAVSPSAKTAVTKPACATPKGYTVGGHDADLVLFGANPTGDSQIYRYCVRADGTKFPIYAKVDPEVQSASLTELAGDYIAYTLTSTQSSSAPNSSRAIVLNALTSKKAPLPDPIVSSESAGYTAGCCTSLVLSPTGVLAGIETTYDFGGTFAPLEDHVIAFQFSLGQSVLLGNGGVGTLNDLAIYACTAGCSPDEKPVIGWQSSGTQEYASLPPTG